ncbi:hypothetical protein ACOYW6_00140 [Parablastomonas sp. CN1-191]|uniref:hypothetical protein n=1 Tax=Parablastomonas sp. CN1-191 TaxID=3400908 RepID=UPI003BF8CD6B
MTRPITARSALVPALLIACLALAACKPSGKDANGTAAGTILPGSTSDAMIPLDQVRSEPPLAPVGSGDAAAKKQGGKGETPGKASDGTDAGAKPAATPSAAAAPAASAAAPEAAAT